MSTQTYELQRAAIDALLEREGIKYTAVFVPQSLSRHSTEKTRSLNWRVTFSRGASMALDYMQGVGHIPAIIGKSYPAEMRAREYEASESGKYKVRANSSWGRIQLLPLPRAADVLHSVVLDNPSGDSFEEWANDFGYDPDSRKAEDIYNQCRKQSREAVTLFGHALLTEIAKILENY